MRICFVGKEAAEAARACGVPEEMEAVCFEDAFGEASGDAFGDASDDDFGDTFGDSSGDDFGDAAAFSSRLLLPERDLVVSADETILELAASAGFACMRYEPADTAGEPAFETRYTASSREARSGVRYTASSLEGLSEVWYRTVWCRSKGLPLEIGRSGKLLLRESVPGDFEALYRISREAGADKYTPTMPEDKALAREQFLSYIETAYPVFGFGLWTVLCGEEVIGRCGFSPDEREDALNLGYLITSSKRQRGYAYEACRIALDYAFEEAGAEKVVADCMAENEASAALLRKLSFAQDPAAEEKGVLRFYLVGESHPAR